MDRISCRPTGFRLAVRGYSEKLPFLFEKVTSRIFSLLEELEEGPEKRPELARKFAKAKTSLLRETKNYRLDAPYDVAAYNLRLLLEESVWYLDDYIAEMEGPFEDADPLTMQDCAVVAKEAFSGRVRVSLVPLNSVTLFRRVHGVVILLTFIVGSPLPSLPVPPFLFSSYFYFCEHDKPPILLVYRRPKRTATATLTRPWRMTLLVSFRNDSSILPGRYETLERPSSEE